MNRYGTVALAAIVFQCGTLMAQGVNGEASFSIAAQQLPSALIQFSDQASVQVVTSDASLEGLSTRGVNGKLAVTKALRTLLEGTGLSYKTVGDSTIALVKGVAQANGGASEFRLARAEQANTLTGPSAEGTSESSSGESTSSRQLEEIIVTAQKRAERIIDVPISIAAFGAEELQRRRITTLDDLAMSVPGLSVQSSGTSQRRLMLRGISNVYGNSSLIGMYLDEASITSAPSTQLDLGTYDLERVEVLRGPQGTLYGEGSAGGTIRFITRDPALNGMASSLNASALFTEGGEPGQHVEGMVNLPLVTDTLGVRIAGSYDRRGGWIDQPAAGRDDFNGQERVDVRTKVLWKPTDRFTANLMAVIHRNDASMNRSEDAEGNFTQVFNLTSTPKVQDDFDVYNATLSYDFAGARLLSTTSYVGQQKARRNIPGRFQATPPGTPAFIFLLDPWDQGADIFTEEMRLTSTGTGPWRWTVGGFYRRAKLDDGSMAYFGLPISPGDPLPDPFPIGSRSLSKSWAVFGDVSRSLTERILIGAGLRYFKDDLENLANGQKASFDATNPRVYAQYKFTNELNTYASVAKGFRSGGFNNATTQPAYDPETVWTYELGVKMALADGRLNADAAVFYSDYTDYQINGIRRDNVTAGSITSNAGSARLEGVEWSLTWRPVEDWTLAFSGNRVDSKFYEIDADNSTHAVGDPLDLFPKYSYSFSSQRDFVLAARKGFARLDYSRQGRSYYRNRANGPWYIDESGIVDMLNLNVGVQWTERLSLNVFAQNLLDDRSFTDAFEIEDNASRSRPRTYGIGFGLAFD